MPLTKKQTGGWHSLEREDDLVWNGSIRSSGGGRGEPFLSMCIYLLSISFVTFASCWPWRWRSCSHFPMLPFLSLKLQLSLWKEAHVTSLPWGARKELPPHAHITGIHETFTDKTRQKETKGGRSQFQQGAEHNKEIKRWINLSQAFSLWSAGTVIRYPRRRHAGYMTPNTSSIIQHYAEGIQLFKQLSEVEINTVFYWEKMTERISSEHLGGMSRIPQAVWGSLCSYLLLVRNGKIIKSLLFFS